MTRIVIDVLDDAATEIIGQALYFREQSPGSTLSDRWDRAVMNAFTSLLSAPERGCLCGFPARGLEGMRRISIPGFPNHFVFYVFVAGERIIRIVHVLHGARDLETFFDE